MMHRRHTYLLVRIAAAVASLVLLGDAESAKRMVHISNNIFCRIGQANYTIINMSGVVPATLDNIRVLFPGQ